MSLPRYPEYKDSGVEWLGEVPAHWSVEPLRRRAILNPSKSEIRAIDDGTLVSFLPMEAVGERGELDLSRTRSISGVMSGYTYFREGDVTFAKITPCFENGKGARMSGLIGGIGFGTTELTVVRPASHLLDGRYLDWVLRSVPFRARGEASMYGAGGQKRVPDEFVREFAFAWPDVEEQVLIATFLIRETAKIDALIAEQEKLLALLAEKRQATISHAVTRGLDPNVPMKDSGIPWLGEVPAHWEVVSLSYLSSIETGATPDRGEPKYWGGTIPWLKTGEVNWTPILDAEEFITEVGLEKSAAKVSPPGTLLMAMYGQGITRGRVAVLRISAAYNQACAAITFDDRTLPEFARYFFMAAYDFIRDSGNETSQMNLSAGTIAKFKLALPPADEQEAIIAHLDVESSRFDALIGEGDRARSLLRERRSAMITAAVTGQIDVRGLVDREAA